MARTEESKAQAAATRLENNKAALAKAERILGMETIMMVQAYNEHGKAKTDAFDEEHCKLLQEKAEYHREQVVRACNSIEDLKEKIERAEDAITS